MVGHDNSAHVVDDGQGQNTYVVVDFYGQCLTNIGLPYLVAARIAAALNLEFGR